MFIILPDDISEVCLKSRQQYSGLVKDEYLIIILGQFSPVLHKHIYCWYLLGGPPQATSNEYQQHMIL